MTEPPRGKRFDDTTATLVREEPIVRPLGAIIEVVDAPATPRRLRFTAGSCVLGAGPDSDLVIHAPTVSRRHARLQLVPEGVLLEDLGSHNGVFHLGQRVGHMVLSSDSRIYLGSVEVKVAIDTEALGDELPLYPGESYRGMVGRSVAMRRVFAALERLEGSLVTVLIEGESGVGKELIAHALHEGSAVSQGPFVAINSAAIAPDLVASELFGHRRGAFTGAVDNRLGAFVSADGGSLFLDEIGELPLPVQPMLLRALESGEVQPVGGDARRRVKIRLIAATNRKLEEEVEGGRFREDLYYRLAVVRIEVPPLCERPDDIEVLAQSFAGKLGLRPLPREIVERLSTRSWPGNVRELRNVIEAFAALGRLPDGRRVQDTQLESLLGQRIDVNRHYAEQKDALVDQFTRLYLQALLAHTGGNQTAAAELAGLGRTYLGRLLQKYGLSKRDTDG